ncbi:MAG: response regulator transcription factor [Brevefilum sp.]
MAENILIIDDERSKWSVWLDALEKQGYPVLQADNAEQARRLLDKHEFGLALVNLKKDAKVGGMNLLNYLKDSHPNMDVIMITSYATMNTSIEALRKGAYDYLVTPVNIVEVVSRVDRCMNERRESAERLAVIEQIEARLNQLKQQLLPEGDERTAHDHILETPDIIVDRRKRLVVKNGEQVLLSPTEFDMLDYLVSNADRVVTASELIRAVQGYDMDEMDARPIVRVNIRRLRQKIEEDTSDPRHVITVRSKGYRFGS